jgi:hypothetical protein
MTDTCTFWAITSESAYGVEWSTPTTVTCNYRSGDNISRNDEGADFTPSAIYRFYGDPGITKGDRIVRGTVADSTPTSAAETVRKIETKTAMRGQSSYDIFTG